MPSQFAFSTSQFLLDLYPPYGSFDVSWTNEVVIYSNAALDTSTVRSAVSVTPPADVVIMPNPTGYTPAARIAPRTSWAANTTYAITIGTSLRTRTGATLN